MAKIAVQLMMVKEDIKKEGVFPVMKKLKDLGFSAVEISQISMCPENVADFKRACDELDMSVAAISAYVHPQNADADCLSLNYDKIVSDCRTLNCKYVRAGALSPRSDIGKPEKVMAFIKDADLYANKLAEDGIGYYYHNHHFEFQKVNGQTYMDMFIENSEKLGFEIDVHWVQRGGENPVTYLDRFAGRLGLLHLKDFTVVPPDFATSTATTEKEKQKEFHEIIRYAEVGEGTLDFPAIIEKGLSLGSEFLIIEQDDTYGRDVYECLKTSRDNLIKMGYGELF